METIFMKMENSKTNEPHKFVLNLSQRLDLISSHKHGPLQSWIHTEPRTKKCLKEYGFLSFARKYKKQIKYKGLDASKK